MVALRRLSSFDPTPWPLPPRSAIFGLLDRWCSHFRFEKDHNVVLFVVDSRRNVRKQRYESPAAAVRVRKAKAALEQAKHAAADDERCKSFCAADWKVERDIIDKAQKEVAAYDRVLIGLLKEWIVDRQYVVPPSLCLCGCVSVLAGCTHGL